MPVIPAHRRCKKENQTKVILGYIGSSRPTEKKQNRPPKLSVHVIWTDVVACLTPQDAGFCHSGLFSSAEGVDRSLDRFKEMSLLCKKCVATPWGHCRGRSQVSLTREDVQKEWQRRVRAFQMQGSALLCVQSYTHRDVSENSDISLWSENSTFSWYGMHRILLTERFI